MHWGLALFKDLIQFLMKQRDSVFHLLLLLSFFIFLKFLEAILGKFDVM